METKDNFKHLIIQELNGELYHEGQKRKLDSLQISIDINELLLEQIAKNPNRTAIVCNQRKLSYLEIDQQSNQVANFIRSSSNPDSNSPIGLIVEDIPEMIIGINGIFKSRKTGLLIDPNLPDHEKKSLIDKEAINLIITGKKFIQLLNRLQWECESFDIFLCLDVDDVHCESDKMQNVLMDSKLWNLIGSTYTDEITGGGWKSSYTGDYFSKEEMDEYGANVLKKLTPFLFINTKVLEIGCASGISMFRIAPKVGLYYGTDLSDVIIKKTGLRVTQEGYTNIVLKPLPAHEIDLIEERDFDIVVINSVVQAFNGHNYLRQVIKKAISLMKDKGIIFIGDVMDLELKQQLVESLIEYKSKNKNSRTMTNLSNELFLSRGFFKDLEIEINDIDGCEFSNKINTIENELTRFRYDVIIKIDKSLLDNKVKNKIKAQYGITHLQQYDSQQIDCRTKPDEAAFVVYSKKAESIGERLILDYNTVIIHSLFPDFEVN